MADFFFKPLLNHYGIVILGKSETTGFGKTQFALRLAVEWCEAQHTGKGVPREDCCVVFSNTIDVAKDIVFKPSYCWVLDEMCPADHAQAIHMSENMMKVLLSPLQPGSIRARNQDLAMPVGLARIITANAENAEEWCGFRLKWTEPLQRKSIVFPISKQLCDEAWRAAGSAD